MSARREMKKLTQQFIEELRELCRREKRWMVILPEVARNMPSPAVDHAVETHLEGTVLQVNRLNRMLRTMEALGVEEAATLRELARDADEMLVAVTSSSLKEGGVPFVRLHGRKGAARLSPSPYSQN